MFTQPAPPAAGPPSTPVSPSRSSRLRGLSYLRNYTHNHLLSREATSNSSPSGTSSAVTSPRHTSSSLTRSVSYTPGALASPAPSPAGSNRITLIGSTPDNNNNRISRLPTTAGSADIIAESTEGNTPQPPAKQEQQQQHQQHQQQTAADAAATAADSDDVSAVVMASGTQGAATATTSTCTQEAAPSIRFSSYFDPRASRPSLSFSPITRTLPNGPEIIRVGRYSERDNQPLANVTGHQLSAAPVGFKSKVVSRRHCEFWCENGKWYIKDVKSSSGTFLNHIRLSPPSQESKAFPVNDGDIVQLGIDFKGGEEMIFRCVKMRLELNRGWQNKPNSFNVAAHKRLRTMASGKNTASGAANSSQDCSICLNSIAPCQSLFVAPCSHTWHFKCIKSLLISPQYPVFICPNCRAGADLEADVEEPSEEWDLLDEQEKNVKLDSVAETPTPAEQEDVQLDDVDRMDITITDPAETLAQRPQQSAATASATSSPQPIRRVFNAVRHGTPSPPQPGAEGPITPRNDIGPWVLDGRAGRESPVGEMTSLNAAASEMDSILHINDDGDEIS